MIPQRFLIPLLLLGCKNPPPQTRPSTAPERPWIPAVAMRSDFSDALLDSRPLGEDLGLAHGQSSDSAINELLAHRFSLPARVRVAILHFPSVPARRSFFPLSDGIGLTQTIADSAVAGVSHATRVERAVVLPALLVGEQPTVATLREAAARLQTDLLLVYRPSCRLFDRQPFIGSRQFRSVCTIEAVLLDTRYGVVPFSTVVTREGVTQHQHGDFDDGGTWRRVQLEALVQAISEVSLRAGNYLTTVPVQ